MMQSKRERLRLIRIALREARRSFLRSLVTIADPLSKWATILTVFVGGGWVFYKFVIAGATDWAINLSVSTQVIRYHDDVGLLVIHVHPKNPLDNEVNLDPRTDVYKVTIQEIPGGKPLGTVIDSDETPAPKMFSKTINMMPKDGYTFLPKVDFDDATSVVVPLDTKLWVTAEIDYQGDYVSANEVVVVPDRTALAEGH